MTLLNYPGWLENAGTVNNAAPLRSYIGALMAGTYNASATSLIPRAGVNPGLGNELQVTQTGSPSMAVVVKSGAAWIAGTEAATQGVYGVLNDGDVTVSITAAHATLNRIDLVGIKVEDSFYSGANNAHSIVAVTGTAASSPVAPTAPNNFLSLGQIAVAAAVTSIVNANITDTRKYLAGAGGVIPYTFDASPLTANEMFEGQLLWAKDTNRLKVFDGSTIYTMWDAAIDAVGIGKYLTAFKTADESVTSSTTFQDDDALTLSLAASAKYIFESQFFYNTNSTANLKVQYTVPSGATVHRTSFISVTPGFGTTNANGNVVNIPGDIASDRPMQLRGTIATTSAGSFTFQWAQNTSNGTASTVRTGSYLRAFRVS